MTATLAGVIVAAASSRSGKTALTLGLIRALRDRGVRVAAGKCGPDYIDPGFLAAAAGRPCLNLDTWAMRPAQLAARLGDLGREADLAVCEGVMGLFDGAVGGVGSTAELAARTGWPVVLVLDGRGQGASAAAVLRGFASHRADVTVAGVIFNRVSGARHAAILDDACAAALPAIPRLGWVAEARDLAMPERHLGLVTAGEHPAIGAFVARAAMAVSARVDVDAFAALARPATMSGTDGAPLAPLPPLGQRIAVARDAAFAFAYPAVLEGWRRQGAEVRPFSPLADEAPDADADAVCLPGGYPELHAGRLAGAQRFQAGLRAAAQRGAVVYGECGGYMALGLGLVDAAGTRHAMAGLLPVETTFAERALALGYRRVTQLAATPLGPQGARFRGHEFHYARTTAERAPPLFACADAAGRQLPPAGAAAGRVFGSFVHLIDADG